MTSSGDAPLPSRTGRGSLPQLEALRFFAILGVLMANGWRAEPSPWILGGLGLGMAGARLFFVLAR